VNFVIFGIFFFESIERKSVWFCNEGNVAEKVIESKIESDFFEKIGSKIFSV